MIVAFHDQGAEDIFNGVDSRAAAKACPKSLWAVARRKLDQLDSAAQLSDLRFPPGNRLESLRGDRSGQHSIRINDQFRLCFVWTSAGPTRVEVVDYH
jgi:toxin HigB-1